MTNYSRLHRMTRDEMADELNRIRTSEVLADIDFGAWLQSSDPRLLPVGPERDVIVYARINGQLTGLRDARVIIIDNNERLFNRRYYKIFDVETLKVHHIDHELLEVI